MVASRQAPRSCVLKLQRATEHYQALSTEIKSFFKDDPNKPIFHFEPDRGERVVRVRILRPLPPELGIIVGDCVYNLRSALDHLVSITMEKWGASNPRSEFPIFLDPNTYAEVDGKGRPTRRSGLAKIDGLPRWCQDIP